MGKAQRLPGGVIVNSTYFLDGPVKGQLLGHTGRTEDLRFYEREKSLSEYWPDDREDSSFEPVSADMVSYEVVGRHAGVNIALQIREDK